MIIYDHENWHRRCGFLSKIPQTRFGAAAPQPCRPARWRAGGGSRLGLTHRRADARAASHARGACGARTRQNPLGPSTSPDTRPLVTRSRWLRSAPPGYSRCSGVCRGHENDLETHPLAGNSLTTPKISPDDRTLPARPRLPVPACWSRLPIRLPTRLPGPHLPSPTAPVSPALTDKQCRPQCRPPAVLAD